MRTFVPKKLYFCTFSIVCLVRHTNIGFCLMLPFHARCCQPNRTHKHAQKGKGYTSQYMLGCHDHASVSSGVSSLWDDIKLQMSSSLLISVLAPEINRTHKCSVKAESAKKLMFHSEWWQTDRMKKVKIVSAVVWSKSYNVRLSLDFFHNCPIGAPMTMSRFTETTILKLWFTNHIGM